MCAAPPGERGRSLRSRGYTLAFPGGFAAHSRVAGGAPGGKKRTGAQAPRTIHPLLSDPNHTQGLGAVVLAGEEAGAHGAAAGREPPVRVAARACVEAGLWPVAVVVRRDAEEARAALAGLPVATALDDAPRPGRATGIRRGLARLRECAPGLRGVAVLDCAEAPADAAHLAALAAALHAGGRPIAASMQDGALGLPALFAAEVLPELLALAGGQGAAEVLAREPSRVTAVPPAAARGGGDP